MRLSRMRIQNYRCFRDQEITFDDYSCLVGVNGSGKSTVLMALNVFFRNTRAPSDVINLEREDFHLRDTSQPIIITCTFTNLSQNANEELRHYVRQGQLVVTARADWDPASSHAEVRQVGVRSVMRDFAPYFEAEQAKEKVAKLKEIYSQLRGQYNELPPPSTKASMTSSLRSYEESHPDLCELVESSAQFYGWSRGENRLSKYIQWVYIPAVKHATEEQDEQRNSALGDLLQRTVRSEVDFAGPLEDLRMRANEEYEQLLASENEALAKVEDRIQSRLREWAHPGARLSLRWHFDERKSVTLADPFARALIGDREFLGEIVRSGHGLQRSFLGAILQVLATMGDEDSQPTLLLGFEEPELYQHPPQAKHLADLLEQLSTQGTQIIMTTHSPYFVSSKGYENVRVVRASNGSSSSVVYGLGYSRLSQRLAAALGGAPQRPTELMATIEQVMQPSQSELFFCGVPVLVEGLEDVAFISTFLQHRRQWKDFRRAGCHFIVCSGKTNMSRPLVIAQELGFSSFVVFDGDCDDENSHDKQRRDNLCLLNLLSADNEPIAGENVFGSNFVMWRTRILDEVRSSVGASTWDSAEHHAREIYKLESGVRRKNPTLIAATLEILLNANERVSPLEKTASILMAHADTAC